MHHHHFGDGRYVARLDPGEDLLACLRQIATDERIEAGLVTGLGSVDQITLGFLDPETGEYLRRRFEERMEVGQLTGSFSMDGERPHVHVHAVVGPRELLAYTGHVHEARVGAVMELFLTRLPGRMERRETPGQAFPALVLPDEPQAEGTAPAR
jgi:uncharacterized protein